MVDSPGYSSSSDDFAALLDAELDSSEGGEDEEEEEEEDEEEEKEEEEDEEEEVEVGEVEIGEGTEFQTNINRDKRRRLEECTDQPPATGLCPHPGFYAGMCMRCGQKIDDGSGIQFGYIHKNLRLANDEIARLRDKDLKSLLSRRKLCLVLDLDHTLLNSTRLSDLTVEEHYLNVQTNDFPDSFKGSLFRLDHIHMMTKLRPFVRTFLMEACKRFEMYIYTMGERPYALEMAKLLDPEEIYFNSRVIAQGDCTQRHQKGLDVVVGQESSVLILDDTEGVWGKHKENLILMERYLYFASSCKQFGFRCKSLSELKSDESESEGALSTVLATLEQIHNLFFDAANEKELRARDVRQVLKTVRKKILEGCKIMFSRVFPSNFPAESHQLWKMAEQLGAICTTEVDPSVTHVVAMDAGTDKSRWALQESKHLIHPSWLEATNYMWKKAPEEKFPVESAKAK